MGQYPTNKDIISAVNHEVEISTETQKKVKEKEAQKTVSNAVIAKYKEISPGLPLIAEESVLKKVERLFESSVDAKRNKLKPISKKNFTEKLNKLFDIIHCQCQIIRCGEGENCRMKDCTGHHVICSCEAQKQIPEKEVSQVKDQREKEGLLGGTIGVLGRDNRVERKLLKKAQKEQNLEKKAEKRAEESAKVEENIKKRRKDPFPDLKATEVDYEVLEELMVEENMNIENSDEEYIEVTKVDNQQTRINIEPYAAEVVRARDSPRNGAAMWNAVIKCLHNHGLIKNEDETAISKFLIVDRYKMKRSMEQFAEKQKVKKKDEVKDGLECIGVDGKRNKKTLKSETKTVNGVKVKKQSVGTEEHIVYTNESIKGDYLTHSTPKDGTGKGLASDMLDVLAEVNSLETLKAVCCDGTATNTGWKDGMVPNLERELQRKLLLLSCMLHANELPFRKLFNSCDGNHGTTGPDSFGGDLGKQAKTNLHLEDIAEFEAVETNLDVIDNKITLSRDQNLLYKYIKAVSKGEVSQQLAVQKVGPLNHSRWLTLAIRLLQLYTRTSAPSDGLRKIVRFIMQVYGPSWFAIKKASKFTNGPALLFQQITLIKTQPQDVQDLVRPTVQRNAYMAEPGVMLCSMIESSSLAIRQKAMEIIKKAKTKPPKKPRMKKLMGIRSLKLPTLDWSAFSWVDLIDWSKTTVHLPHIIESLTDEQVCSILWGGLSFPAFPLHTQTVERAVKLVTEAASKVEGEERRHGFILSVIESRRTRKAFTSKGKYTLVE